MNVNVRRSLAVVTAALLIGLAPVLGLASPAAAQGRPTVPPGPEPGRPGQDPPAFVAGEILVSFKPGAGGQEVAEAHRQNGGRVKGAIGGLDVQVVEVPAGQEQARVAGYRATPSVAFAELNGIYHAVGHATTDAKVGQQWQYNNTGQTGGGNDADIDAVEAWHLATGATATGGRVAIAILDTGIDESHEDLKAKVAKRVNFTTSPTADDQHGHGTHVAGSAAAATGNGLGVAGTCPDCALYSVKVLGDDAWGSWSWLANGINWATDNGAQVVNMSLGGYTGSETLRLAVDRAWQQGVVLVAAAGNDGRNASFYPAAYANVIAVGATDHADAKPSWSNYGGDWVDVAAPGLNILSTATDHATVAWPTAPGYASGYGTSMATPHVAGVAGLVWSKAGLCATNACVRGRVESTADKVAGTGSGTGDFTAHGRINAAASLGGATVGPAPDTTITAKPTDPSSSADASFSFGASVPGSTFECKLDDGAYAACSSPKTYAGLTGGSHTFEVRAKDATGNTDTTPASHTWTVDTVAPDTTITAKPADPSSSADASVSFSASEPGSIFECKLDAEAFGPCTSPKSYTGLAGGSHTFQVRAKDAAGNVDATPAGHTWTVSLAATPAPAVTGISPESMKAGTTVPVKITGTGFQSGAKVTFENGSGSTPTATSVLRVDATTITATVQVGGGGPARPRVWDVRVTNPDGSSAIKSRGFTVNR